MTPHRGTSGLLREIVGRVSVPLMILGFAGAFAYSSHALPFRSAGYPRFLIALLVPIVLVIIVREILGIVRRRREATRGAAQGHAAVADAGPTRGKGWRSWLPVLVTGGWLIALVLGMPHLGVMPAVGIFIPGVLVSLGYRPWWGVVAITAATLLAIQILFVNIFALPLPGVW